MSIDHAVHESHEHLTGTRNDHAQPSLNAVALSATLHCLSGCAIGIIIGTALGFSDSGTIALAVALAFLFGY